MNELWSRCLASIHDGKVEDFKRLAEDLLSTIRETDSETLNYAICLDESVRVAVIIAQYASPAGWLAHNAKLDRLIPHFSEVCEFTEIDFYGDPTPEALAAFEALGARYYPTFLAL
jgi:quinol monooxygenase YgiN